jgi:hypothetical protein
MTIDPALDLALRVSLALLFGAAVRHKLAAPRSFVEAVRRYELVADGAAAAVALALVTAEASAAVLLAVPIARAAAALLAAALLLLYAAAIGAALARGRRDLDCGCAGPNASQPIHRGLVARNVALAATSLLTLLPAADRPLGWLDSVTVVAAVLAAAALYAAVDRLLANQPAVARARGVA